ncbi:MAG: hypothetical protein HKN28_07555 [Alphaproteobacteria bacterium]|nr:hypothetical protein [Alphaproteobacteria bacterium]
MTRYLAVLILSLAVLADSQSGRAGSAEIILGGQSAHVELPDGYCVMTEFEPSDARLIGFLRVANQGTNTVRLTFANCSQLVRWRKGELQTLDDYGYVSTPDQFETTPVNMELPAFIELISKSLNSGGMKDFERGIEEGTDRVNERIPEIKINETQNLGVIFEDDKALYVGIVQKLRTEFGDEKVILGSTANTVLKNRVAHIYLYTAFSDNALGTLLDNSRTLVDRTIAANER